MKQGNSFFDLGFRIRHLRLERNITQAGMALSLGLSQSGYNKKENGELPIHEEELEVIAKQLELSSEFIKTYTPTKSVQQNSHTQDNAHNQNIAFVENLFQENKETNIALIKSKDEQIEALKSEIIRMEKMYNEVILKFKKT